ncbi:uncharacterized protein ISCGN_001328 [Ixodes scapularis]
MAERGRIFSYLRLLLCAVTILELRRVSPTTPRHGDHFADHGITWPARIPDAARAQDSLGHWLSTKPKAALVRSICVRQPQIVLLLLLAGDVSSNPGPCPSCLRCGRSVYENVAALQCDKCDSWLHRKCELLSLHSYRRLSSSEEEWYCGACQLPAFDDELFPTCPTPASRGSDPTRDPVIANATPHGQPQANLANSTGRRRSPWITESIIQLAQKKRKLFRRAKKTNHLRHLSMARQAQRDLKKEIYTSHRSYVETIAQKAARSPKLFWSYVNHRRKSSSSPEFTVDGTIVESPQTVAELFSAQFSTAWTVPDTPSAVDTRTPPGLVPLGHIDIGVGDVAEALRHLKPSQGAGPDGVHPMLLKACSERLSTVLARLFANFLQAGSVPSQWKLARVTPVHKGNGSPTSSVASYRPISSTSVVCRTMERILNKRLLEHLEQYGLLSPCQYGFRPGRSCELALAETVHTLSSHLDNRIPCQLLQLDFKQAFDRVDHNMLRRRLSEMGITGCLENWISDFLRNRSQRVVFRGAVSSPKQVMSGIPQGSTGEARAVAAEPAAAAVPVRQLCAV